MSALSGVEYCKSVWPDSEEEGEMQHVTDSQVKMIVHGKLASLRDPGSHLRLVTVCL